MTSNRNTSAAHAAGKGMTTWVERTATVASIAAAFASGMCAMVFAQSPVPGSLDTTFNGTGKITNLRKR